MQKKNDFVFTPLGGAEKIGMNLYLYGYQDQWLMVDCGIAFGNEETAGVDILMPDIRFISKQKDKLVGLVLTHVHEDHFGAISYLWKELGCPIYTTPFGARMLEDKLTEAGLLGKVPLHEIKNKRRLEIGVFDIEFIHMTHSIPEANAIAIRTPEANILHTGDWKLDPEPLIGPATDFDSLKTFASEGITAVVGDSTGTLNDDYAGSEGKVRQSFIELFKKYKHKKIAVTCFASNVVRVESIAMAAKLNGRKVALVGRSLWRAVGAAQACGYLKDVDFMEADEAEVLANDEVLYICTGSQGEKEAALSRIAHDSHKNLKLREDDLIIFSSRVIPGNEMRILDLQNHLTELGLKIITCHDEFVHVSGHGSREEITELYTLLQPQSVLPVHGEPLPPGRTCAHCKKLRHYPNTYS